MSFPKPTLESEMDASNSHNIGQMLKDFSQQEIFPKVFVLEEMISHQVGELPNEQNHLACLSDSVQPQPLKFMFEPP